MVGDVVLDVTLPDVATGEVIRAAIEAQIRTPSTGGVDLVLPREASLDYRQTGSVVIDDLSDSETAERVEAALREIPEIDLRSVPAAAGVTKLVVFARGRQPLWEFQAFCVSWSAGAEAAFGPDVKYEGSERLRQREGDVAETRVTLAVRADNQAAAQQRVSESLAGADVRHMIFVTCRSG